MNLKKLLALALSLCLALPLAACGDSPAAESSDTPTGSSSPSESASPAEPSEEPLPEYVHAFTQAVAGVDGDTVMFTVDGMDVTAEFYLYWLANYCYMADLQSQMYLGTPLDLSQQSSDGTTLADSVKDGARSMATVYLILEKEAPAKGAEVTPEQQASLDAQKSALIEERGRDGFETLLHQEGLSEPLYERLSRMSGPLLQNMEATYPAPTEEEADQYIEENDLLRAKHILIRTVTQKDDGTIGFNRSGQPTNEDGSAYTGTVEEYNAAALEKANSILAQLNAAEDPLTLFDQLMQENSEDPGLSSYPDGYDFTAGQMVSEFEQGTRDLEYDQYSTQPVQSDDGYHIILRLRPQVDDNYRQQELSEQMEEWASLEFTTTPAYDNLDVKDFYEKYTAYKESFMEDDTSGEDVSDAPSEAPAEGSSEAPAESPSASPSDVTNDLPSEVPSETPEG